MSKTPHGLILLTYKGKVLLMHKQKGPMDDQEYPWSFISGLPEKRESLEKALIKRVEKEMGIKIENIEFVADYYYHARLTDDNVNNIVRSANQLLDFFSLKDLKKLNLSLETREFIAKYGLRAASQNTGFSY